MAGGAGSSGDFRGSMLTKIKAATIATESRVSCLLIHLKSDSMIEAAEETEDGSALAQEKGFVPRNNGLPSAPESRFYLG